MDRNNCRKSKMTTIILVMLSLAAVLAGWAAWETYAPDVEYVEIPISGLPAEFDGFRIAQISDLHGRRMNPAGREVRAIRAAGVDIVAVTGDFVTGKAADLDCNLPFLQELAAVAPLYAVSGNHDYWTDWPYIAGRLRETGIAVLENAHVRLSQGDAEIILAGVCDPFTGRDDLGRALPKESDTVVLLLAHAPTWFAPVDQAGAGGGPPVADRQPLLDRISLTLAGHTHGGQIKLPLLGAVTTASGRLFPRTHVEGLSREGNGWLYINRGLGHVYLPVRFLARPEVTVITLRRDDDGY